MTAIKRIVLALMVLALVAGMLPVVGGVLPWAADGHSVSAERDAQLAAIDIEMQGLPPVTAPGAAIPLHWVVSGGSDVSSTRVFYDKITHEYDRAYLYGTPLQSGPAGHYFDYVEVPEDYDVVYLTPYAAVDDEMAYGRQYTVPMRRAINIGSNAQGNDDNNEFWAPDLDWYGQVEGGDPNVTTTSIADTVDDWIYQSQREGIESYTCNLTSGVWSMEMIVEIHLAEFDATGPNQRVFDITLEPDTPNEVVIPNIDVYASVGSHRAMVITRTVTVDRAYDTSQYRNELDVVFASAYGHAPICNGIVMRGLSAVPQRQCSQVPVIAADDTYINPYYRNEPIVRLGGAGEYHGGFRFQFLPVASDAVINRAYLWLTPSEDSWQDLRLTIYAEDVDNAPGYGSGTSSVGSRSRTDASVEWVVPREEGWRQGRVVESPDLTALIQEVVSRPGWQPRNAIGLMLIAGQGDSAGRQVWAYDGSPVDSAVLYIDYTPRHQMPTPVPTFTHTPTATHTPTVTPTPTCTSTPEATATATSTLTPEPTATSTATLTVTPSMTPQSRFLYLPLAVTVGLSL